MLQAFEKVASGIDTRPLRRALESRPALWDELTARQDTPGTPHQDTRAIILRWAKNASVEAAFTAIDAVDYPAYLELPEAREYIASLCAQVGATQLGRVMVVELAPGGFIRPHADEGAYADYYERFHLVLQSEPGNRFYIELEPHQGEWAHMKEGEVWWFNHKLTHFVQNQSGSPRVHLIVDAVAPEYRKERVSASPLPAS